MARIILQIAAERARKKAQEAAQAAQVPPVIEHYQTPDYLNNGKAPPEQKNQEMQGPPVIGHYHSPTYLKNVAAGSEHGNRLTAPVSVSNPAKSASSEGKLGSIAPTPYSFKKDLVSPVAVPVITTCSLCNGLVKNGECVACSGRQCPICGEMNYATSTNCSSCKQTL